VCYSNSSTSSNIELSVQFNRKIPDGFPELTYFFASGYNFPKWRVITKDSEIQIMKWGLVPYWYKSQKEVIAKHTLNCRVETLFEKPSFNNIAKNNRCIIPSSGFFEWQQIGNIKVPYFIFHPKGEIMSFAGLWDKNINCQTGEEYLSFSILTCEANEFLAKIHNFRKRMPLIIGAEISPEDWLCGKIELNLMVENTKSIKLSAHQVDKKLLLSQNSNCVGVQLPFTNNDSFQVQLF
jgi:putative SOS response-associated peptidase YedK